MTDYIRRDDAIKTVIRMCAPICDNTNDVVKAIDALPSAEYSKPLQTTLNGDFVSRADAIEAVCKLCVDGQTAKVDGYFIPIRDALENVLKALPSADSAQGEWMQIEETLPTYDGGEKTWLTGMKCSNCGKLFDLRVGYHYCPSCGARMYKGGDDE